MEIDGGYHQRQKDFDALRTEVINMLGIDVIRFTNEEVMNNITEVLTRLENKMQKRTFSAGFNSPLLRHCQTKQRSTGIELPCIAAV